MAAITRRYNIEIRERGARELQENVRRADTAFAGFSSTLKRLGPVIAGVFSAKALIDFGRSAVNTAAQFEALQARLENMFGSVQRGQQAFETFRKVAETTPFAVQEVIEAGAALKAFGLDAENTIKITADLAAFMGVTIPEAASALGRAFAGGAGAADIFRERGILNLIKMKSGIEDFSKITLEEFRTAMFQTFTDPTSGIIGATDRMAETLQGRFSNLGDAIQGLQNAFGQRLAPAIKDTTNSMISLINSVTDFLEVSPEEKIKEEQLEFNALINVLKDANTSQETRNQLIEQLQSKYGDYLGNLDLEKATIEDLAAAQQKANDLFMERIRQVALSEILEEESKRAADAAKRIAEYTVEIEKLRLIIEQGKETFRDGVSVIGRDSISDQQKRIALLQQWIRNLEEEMQEAQHTFDQTNRKFQELFGDTFSGDRAQGIDATRRMIEELSQEIEDQNDLMQDLQAAYLSIAEANIAWNNMLIETQQGLEDLNPVIRETASALEGISEVDVQIARPGPEDFNAWDVFRNKIRQVEGVIASAFVRQWREGENAMESFLKGFRAMLEQMVAEMLARAAIFGLLNLFTGGLAGGILGGSFSSFVFGGGRQHGGPVEPQRGYLVGERGPEIFVPRIPGEIIPNNRVQTFIAPAQEPRNINQSLNVTIVTPDVGSFEHYLRHGGGIEAIAKVWPEYIG